MNLILDKRHDKTYKLEPEAGIGGRQTEKFLLIGIERVNDKDQLKVLEKVSKYSCKDPDNEKILPMKAEAQTNSLPISDRETLPGDKNLSLFQYSKQHDALGTLPHTSLRL